MNETDYFGNYLTGQSEPVNQQRDEKQLKLASLQNDYNNIRQTQQSYGVPTIGDLFKARPEDIEETIKSVHFMMKQRVADIDFKQEIRTKISKQELAVKE